MILKSIISLVTETRAFSLQVELARERHILQFRPVPATRHWFQTRRRRTHYQSFPSARVEGGGGLLAL